MIFGFNVGKIRKDFPILEKGVIYFDSACMSLKPRQVIDKVVEYQGSALLVVEPELADSLKNVAIDVEDSDDGNQLVIVDKPA